MRKTFGVVLALFVSLFSAAGLVSCGEDGNGGAVEDGSGGVRSVSHEMVDLGFPSGRLLRLVRQLFGGAALERISCAARSLETGLFVYVFTSKRGNFAFLENTTNVNDDLENG